MKINLLNHYILDVVFAVLQKGTLLVPSIYTAGSGDLHVQLHTTNGPATSSMQLTSNITTNALTTNSSSQDLRLQITRLPDAYTTDRITVAILDVYPDPRLNVTQITVPCHHFLYGGIYELEIVGNDIQPIIAEESSSSGGGGGGVGSSLDERLRQQMDVRWPIPKLDVTPESIGTYPQQPVDVILKFPGVDCSVTANDLANVPEFWLELFYCGHNVYCDSTNVTTAAQVLYSEQVRGYPKTRLVKLRCELFGLAGHYIVKLRPMAPVPASVSATAYIKV